MPRMRSTKLAPLSESCEKYLRRAMARECRCAAARELVVQPQRAQAVARRSRVEQAERGPDERALARLSRRGVRGGARSCCGGASARRRERRQGQRRPAQGVTWQSCMPLVPSALPRETFRRSEIDPGRLFDPVLGTWAAGRDVRMPPAAILDIDGTLVDTNYHHAIAWYRAFRQHGVRAADLAHPPAHRHGRRPVRRGARRRASSRARRATTSARPRRCSTRELIGEVEPLDGARELIEDLKDARPRGRARQLGEGGRGRPLPRPARRPRSGRTTGPTPTTWRPRSRSPTSCRPRWRRRAAARR